MKRFLLLCISIVPLSISGQKLTGFVPKEYFSNNDDYKIDSARVINKLYADVKLIPFKGYKSFDYRFYYKDKIVTVISTKTVGDQTIKYVIELKDTKGIFNKNNFSAGDNYQYLGSYFILGTLKLPLDKVRSINDKTESLTRISSIWNDFGGFIVKYYQLKSREIYLIKGTDAYCNGHNCSDYVMYILQKENHHASVQSIYFSGRNYPSEFDNTSLFYTGSDSNPQIMIPRTDKFIRSKAGQTH